MSVAKRSRVSYDKMSDDNDDDDRKTCLEEGPATLRGLHHMRRRCLRLLWLWTGGHDECEERVRDGGGRRMQRPVGTHGSVVNHNNIPTLIPLAGVVMPL